MLKGLLVERAHASRQRSDALGAEFEKFNNELKVQEKVVAKNTSASLYDLGDGVLGLRFHSKMNALDDDIFKMYSQGMDELDGVT